MAKLKTGRHTSAIKATRQALRRKYRNRAVVKNAKEATKAALASTDKSEVEKLLSEVSSTWDKAVKSAGIHWKTAARRKSRLAKRLKKSTSKPASKA
jgi:small subunit ribosomal protein S20